MSTFRKLVVLAIAFGLSNAAPHARMLATLQGAQQGTTTPNTEVGSDVTTAAVSDLHINEVESNSGVPGDWVELINSGSTSLDISGWRFLDNDDTHVPYIIPAGSVIAAGGYFMLEEANFGFGLGSADSARLYDVSNALYETYSWTAHASTTYGRCPNGTGAFVTTTSVTKGAANDCSSPIRINEVESENGVPGDWVELYNSGTSTADISGFVLRDSNNTNSYSIPALMTVAPGGYYVVEGFGFELDGNDSVRLFTASGVPVDSYSWTSHAPTTYGRCPSGTGAFTVTASPTKGTVNACTGPVFTAWPGDPAVQTADGLNVFGGNLSGLTYEGSGGAPGVLWAVRNGPGALFRLVWDGAIYTPDLANNWGAGKALAYPNGTLNPDSEGVTFAEGSFFGIYVSTERNNNVSGVSRNSILRFDPSAAGTTLTATQEWDLTADLPAVGPNLGMEAIAWIPDSFLVPQLFFDESKGHVYNPGEYPNHGSGLFVVGLEANGILYAYALDHVTGGFTRIATISSSLPGVMDLQFDRELRNLWAICDDTCDGRAAVLRISATTGRFAVSKLFERPGGMPNLNNEGFAFAPLGECAANLRPAFWSDDSETAGHAVRRGTLTCIPFAENNVQMTSSGFVRDRRTGTYVQQITIINNSSTTLAGPFYFVLDNLSPNAASTGALGTTANFPPLGSPYIQITATALAPAATASVVVEFVNPTNTAITYSGRVINGDAKP